MAGYKRILLAIELYKADANPIRKAICLAKQNDAQLIMVHAIEEPNTYGTVYGVSLDRNIETELMTSAINHLQKLGEKALVAPEDQIVKYGSAKFVIAEEAERLKPDLIVMGSHGRHGIRLLLGSTANGVLHTVKCDVLAVRLTK